MTLNERLALNNKSLTVMVMTELPVWFAAGVMVTVRFAPVPAKTTFDSGMIVGLDELPVTSSASAGVSRSPIANGIGGRATLISAW